jgi:hypothetical protein
MQGKQIHVLPPPSLKFFQQWVDIMLSIDGIHTLANMVISRHYSHLSKFDFSSYFMSWNGCDNGSSGKKGLYHD